MLPGHGRAHAPGRQAEGPPRSARTRSRRWPRACAASARSSGGSSTRRRARREFEAAVRRRLEAMVARQPAAARAGPIALGAARTSYRYVSLAIDARTRVATLTMSAPDRSRARRPRRSWRGQARTRGPSARGASSTTRCSICASTTRASASSRSRRGATRRGCSPSTRCSRGIAGDGLVREVTLLMKRVLKRLDNTAKTLLRADRARELLRRLARRARARGRPRRTCSTTRSAPASLRLSPMNAGPLPMSNGLTRLASRFLGRPERVARLLEQRRAVRREERARGGPRHVRARRHRLGRRGARRLRGAREPLARRADRHGGEPPLRRPGDDGDEDLRAPLELAELDLPAAQRGRPAGRAHALRQARAAGVRLRTEPEGEERMSSVNADRDPEQRSPRGRQAPAARARGVAAELHPLVARDGPVGLPGRPRVPAHRDRRRLRRLGALRLRQDARLPLGHLPRRSGGRPHHRLRRRHRPAGVAGGAGRAPEHAAPPHRHPGRHRAGERRAAAQARAARARASTTCATSSR